MSSLQRKLSDYKEIKSVSNIMRSPITLPSWRFHTGHSWKVVLIRTRNTPTLLVLHRSWEGAEPWFQLPVMPRTRRVFRRPLRYPEGHNVPSDLLVIRNTVRFLNCTLIRCSKYDLILKSRFRLCDVDRKCLCCFFSSLLNMLMLVHVKWSACARNPNFKGLMYFLFKKYHEY